MYYLEQQTTTIFSESDTTNCFYKLYKLIEDIIDTKSTEHLNCLLERYYEASLKNTRLFSKESS